MNIKLFTPQEIADVLKINYRKVLDLIHIGKLQAYRVGNSLRISEESLIKFLDNFIEQNSWEK